MVATRVNKEGADRLTLKTGIINAKTTVIPDSTDKAAIRIHFLTLKDQNQNNPNRVTLFGVRDGAEVLGLGVVGDAGDGGEGGVAA